MTKIHACFFILLQEQQGQGGEDKKNGGGEDDDGPDADELAMLGIDPDEIKDFVAS